MLFLTNHLTCKHTNFYPNQTTNFIDLKNFNEQILNGNGFWLALVHAMAWNPEVLNFLTKWYFYMNGSN